MQTSVVYESPWSGPESIYANWVPSLSTLAVCMVYRRLHRTKENNRGERQEGTIVAFV